MEEQHTKITTSEVSGDYLCTECQRTFSTNGNLKNHIQTIHKNHRPFKCPYEDCNKNYSNQSRLDVHVRTHTGEKPFVCNICQKSFNEKGNLKTHIGFHANLRPFKCNSCNKTYKTNGHLKDHMEIQHDKVRKFECKFCDIKFGRSSTLIAHLRTHTGEKSYKCKIEGCDKYFAEKGNMEMHRKRHQKRLDNEYSQMNLSIIQHIDTYKSYSIIDEEMITAETTTRPSSDCTLGINENLLLRNNEKEFWQNDDDIMSISSQDQHNVFNINFMPITDSQRKESDSQFEQFD